MNGDPQSCENAVDPASTIAPPARRRLQFSLIGLLWLTTLVACALALAVMYLGLRKAKSEMRTAHEEVEKYRGEMGYLDVVDAKKIYARGIKTTKRYRWSWRIYLPQGHQYQIRIATDRIPPDGYPPTVDSVDSVVVSDPGEHILDAFADSDADGKWRLNVDISDSRNHMSEFEIKPLSQTVEEFSDVCDLSQQDEANAGDSPILLRYRTFPTPAGLLISTTSTNPQPCNGFMIWIEPQK